MKIDTFILCTTNDDVLGIDGDDIWLPCKIDFSFVYAIKKNGRGEYEDKAVLYINDNHFVVKLTYEEALKIWQ